MDKDECFGQRMKLYENLGVPSTVWAYIDDILSASMRNLGAQKFAAGTLELSEGLKYDDKTRRLKAYDDLQVPDTKRVMFFPVTGIHEKLDAILRAKYQQHDENWFNNQLQALVALLECEGAAPKVPGLV